jgi:hypothetical protein
LHGDFFDYPENMYHKPADASQTFNNLEAQAVKTRPAGKLRTSQNLKRRDNKVFTQMSGGANGC